VGDVVGRRRRTVEKGVGVGVQFENAKVKEKVKEGVV
jgi:hypothetical protein